MQSSARHQRIAFMALLFGGAAIGFAPIFIRFSPLEAGGTVFWRLALSLPLFLSLVAVEQGRRSEAPINPAPQPWWRLTLPGLFFGVDTLMWTFAIGWTTVANATLIANLAPIFVTLAAWLLFNERVTRQFLVGLFLSFAGTALLVGQSFELSLQNVLGDLLSIGAAVLYGGYQLSLSRLRRGYSTATLWTWGCIAGLVPTLVWVYAEGGELMPAAGFTFAAWAPLLGIAVVSHFMGQGSIAYGFAHLPASLSSLSLLIQPVVAALAAWALLSEALSVWQILGGAIVLGGIAVARSAQQQPPRGSDGTGTD